MIFPSVLAAALLILALGLCRAETWQESLLQNDHLAALSWALFDIDPYSFVGQNNKTEQEKNEDFGGEETYKSPSARIPQYSEEDDIEEYHFFDYNDDTRNNGSLKNRQLINIQGMRPKLKVEIRMLKIKLFEVYKNTSFNMFLGTGTTGYLDDIFHFKERSRVDSFLTPLEDLVSLIGVDGPACIHRMFCEMGAAPVFKTNGLFGELVDLTIRHMLTSVYADASSNSFHSSSEDGGREGSSPVSYLDAVAAGRHGANCALTFNKCPISLLELANFIQDDNL